MGKKETLSITKYDEALENWQKEMRTYINSPEKFAEVLTAIKKAEMFIEDMKERVKDKGREIMDAKDLKEIEFGAYVVRRIDPSETNEFQPSSVISAFVKEYGEKEGLSMVAQFLKVSTTGITKWLIKGRVPMNIIEEMKLGMRVKIKKGFIGLYPKKEGEEKKGPLYIK